MEQTTPDIRGPKNLTYCALFLFAAAMFTVAYPQEGTLGLILVFVMVACPLFVSAMAVNGWVKYFRGYVSSAIERSLQDGPPAA